MGDRNSELFESVKQNPDDLASIEALESSLTEGAEWSELVELYAHLGQAASDGANQSAYLRKAAEIEEVKLENPIRAIEFLHASLEGDDSAVVEVLSDMRRLLKVIEDWDNYLEVASNELELVETEEQRAELLFEIGSVLESQAGDKDQALECFQAAFDNDPNCLKALWAARRIFREQQDWDLVAQLFQIEMEMVSEPARRAEVLKELGGVYLHDLEQAEQALACFEEVLAIVPDDPMALEVIEQLVGSTGDAESVEPTQPSEESDLDTGASASALASLDDDMSEEQVEFAGAEHEEPSVNDDELSVAESGDAREPMGEVDESYDQSDLVETSVAVQSEPIEQSDEVLPSDSDEFDDTPDAHSVDSQSQAPNAEDSDNGEAVAAAEDLATQTSESAANAEDSDRGEAPTAVEDSATQTSENVANADDESDHAMAPQEADEDKEARLVEVLEMLEAADADERYELLVEATGLASGSDVVSLYLDAIKASPRSVLLHWKVGQHLTLTAAQSEEIGSGIEELAAADYDGAADALNAHRLLFGAVHLDEARTVDFKLRDLMKKGNAADIAPFQIQQFLQGNKWRNIQQALATEHGGDPGEARLYALRTMANLATERLPESDKAADFWRQVHQVDKQDKEARRALLTAYEKLEKWKEFAEILRLEVDDIPDSDTDEKLAGLRRLVSTVSQHLRQDAQVIQLYGQILELAPGDEEASEALCEKYEKMRRWPDLIALLRQRAEGLSGPEGVEISLRIASVYLDKMRNQMEATRAYEELLAEHPENIHALQALDGLYEKRREWDSLVSIRSRLAELNEDPDARLQAYKDLAHYADSKIRRPAVSQALWEEILSIAPDDVDAMSAVIGIYEQSKEWTQLVEGIDRLVDHLESKDEQVNLLLKSGSVLQDRLNDVEGAAAVWGRLLEIDPENRRAGDSYKKVLTTLGQWDDLEDFLGGIDRWTELVRILEGQVGTQKDASVQLDLLFRAARIYDEHVEQADKAIRALERILQIDANNLDAARRLEPIYVEQGDFRKLVQILEILAGAAEDLDERISLMGRLASAYENELRNPMAAFDWTKHIVDANGADAGAREELTRLGSLTNQWGAVHDALADALESLESDEESIQVLLTLGRILDEQLGAVDDALVRYNEVLSIDATNQVALDAVEQLYQRTGSWYELLGILEQKIAAATDVEAKIALVTKTAIIQEEQLDDLDAAVQCYRQLLDLSAGDDPDTLAALDRLYSALQQWDELRDILQQKLELALQRQDSNDEINVRHQLVNVLLTQLDDVEPALDQLQAILAKDSDNDVACSTLEGLLGHEEISIRVALLLEPIYEGRAKWSSLVETLNIRLNLEESDAARCALLRRILATHRTRTADLRAAFEANAQLLRMAPEEVLTLKSLTELAEHTGQWPQAVQLIEDITAEQQDPSRAVVLLEKLAHAYEFALDNAAMAIDAHRRVLEIEPDTRSALDALERLYGTGEQWTDLLEVYRRKLEWQEESEERKAQLTKIAQLLEDLLSDPQGAIAVHGEILEENPGDEDALRSLARLYQSEAMWVELADVVEQQVAIEEDAEQRADMQVRLGELREQRLGETEQGIEIYRSVLEQNPDHDGARAALERTLDDVDFKALSAAILAPIYEVRDDWSNLISALEIQVEMTEEDEERLTLLHRIAELHKDRGAAPARAFETYARAFRIEPSHPSTLDMLNDLADALNLWSELADVYRANVAMIADVEVATDIHIRLAKIVGDKLDNIEEARENYEAALQNDDTAIGVIEALEVIYERTERWEPLVALLIRKVELVTEDEERCNLLFKTASLFEDVIDDSLRAIETYRMVDEIAPDDHRAIEALERLFLASEHWQDYLDILNRKAELTDDIEQRKVILTTIGQTFERELGDFVGAVETYQGILELDSYDLDAMRRLDQLFEHLEQWDDQLAILKLQAEHVEGEEGVLSLQFRMARLHELQLGDLETAIEGYRQILEASSNHEQARHALENMIREGRDADEALGVLEKILSGDAEWTRLIGAWNDYLAVSDDLDGRSRVRMNIAKAYDEQLADSDGAFNAYGDALKEDATNEEALNALETLARRMGAWTGFVELIESQVEQIPSEYIAKDFYLRLARVFDEELRSGGDAIERYRRVLEIDPEHEDTILSLDRLYQQEGRWPDLADILHLRVERAEPEDQVDLLMRLGNLYESALENLDNAIYAYRDVLEIRGEHEEAIESLRRIFQVGHEQVQIGEILEPIYVANENHQHLHELLEALLVHIETQGERNQALHRLARLSIEELDNSELALKWYGQTFTEDPSDEDARAEIKRIAQETERFADEVAFYSAALENTNDSEIMRSICLDLASVYRERMNDDESAEKIYRFVVADINPAEPDALAGLADIMEKQARWDELVGILPDVIDTSYEESDRIRLTSQLAHLFEEKLADIDNAVIQYNAVLEYDPYQVDALEHLSRIYQVQERWAELFDVNERQKENAASDLDKADISAAMAQLAGEFLQRPDDAIDLWNEVLSLRGEDMAALRSLENLYTEQESWRELVDVCDRQIGLLDSDPARELQLYSKLGRVWGDELDRERNAIDNWQKVLRLEPDNLEGLWALRDLYERSGEMAELAETIESLLLLLDSDDERCLELYRQSAILYQESLSSPEKAIGAWRNVLVRDPSDRDGIDNLEELYTATENWVECVAILEAKALGTDDNYDRVSILFRVAEMYTEQLQDSIGSRRAFENILQTQPENIDAYEQLVALYEASDSWEELVGLLLNRLEYTDDTYEQVELYQRTAGIFETHLHSGENAFVVLSQAFEATLDDDRFGEDLERLAHETDNWASLIETYQNVISAMGSTFESIPMRLRVADWWNTKLGDAQNAAQHYQQVLTIEPDNLSALSALEVLLEQYESWDDAVGILQRKVELTHDPDVRKAAYEKMARLLETHLDRGDDAIESYRQAMLIDMSDRSVLDALERLYTVRMRWEELIEILSQQAIIITNDDEIVEKYLQIGELWESRLSSPDRAIDAYRQALSLDEKCLDAMRALEHLYGQQERWYDILDIYQMMSAVLTEPARRVEVLNRQGAMQVTQMQDISGAIDTYRRVLGLQPESADAVEALEGLYRREERWEDLADVYELHLNAVEDVEYQNAIRTMMSTVYRDALGDYQRAIESLLPILDVDAYNEGALTSLAALYTEMEDWSSSIEMLAKLVEASGEIDERCTLQTRIGTIYQERLEDNENAASWYQKALALNNNHLPALEGLKGVYIASGDWQEAIRVLQMMEAGSRQLEDKSRYLFQIGELNRSEVDDQTVAIDYFEQAIDLWPENVDAAAALIDVYWGDENWPRAEPLLALLIQQSERTDSKSLQDLYYRAGVCSENLHKFDVALTQYRHSYELDSTHLPTLQKMGHLLVEREDWDRAFKIFQTLLVHHREHLNEQEIARIFYQQGHIKLQLNEKRKALDFFRKSLDIESDNLESLRAVAALHEARGEWEDVVHYRRRVVEKMPEGSDRFEMMVSIGEVLGEKLGNTRAAIEIYDAALTEEPGSRLVLGKLLGLHETAGNWSAAVEVLTQLAELEDNGTRKAKYWCGVATIQQKYLDDRFMAVRSFDNALEADPSMLRAFQAIDRLLTEDKDYERQDRYYRKMLKRATDNQLDDGLIYSLAKNLGEINRSRLKRYSEAIKAYRIALSRKPDDSGILTIMAQLHELEENSLGAVKQYYSLIRLEPTNIENYRSLKRLFMENEEYDKAWCVCQVLCFLNKATQEERVFFEKHRSRTLKQAQRALEPKHWAMLTHPLKSTLLDQLLQRLYVHTMPAMSVTHKQVGINRRKALIDTNEQTPFNSVVTYVAQTMRVGVPECYAAPSNFPGVNVVNFNPPALLVGQDVARGARMQELAFMNAKQIMLMLPQHILSTMDQTYEQRKTRILGTAYTLMKLVNPAANAQFDADLLDILASSIAGSELADFGKLIQQMSQDPNTHLNVSHWLEGLEHSTNRFGLLLCNDLVAAASVLKTEAGTFSRASVKDRVRELILYAISPEYFELRTALGLAVGS